MKRRGLTLLEVLASAALLTLVTSVSIPLIRDAARLSSTELATVVQGTAQLRDALAALPDSERDALGVGSYTLETLGTEPIVITASSGSDDGDWLICTWHHARILLWQHADESLGELR